MTPAQADTSSFLNKKNFLFLMSFILNFIFCLFTFFFITVFVMMSFCTEEDDS